MYTCRPSVVRIAAAMMVTALVAAPASAQQRDPYPATLHHGTGLVTIPVAWVSSRSADVWLQSSAKTIPWAPDKEKHNLSSYVNTNLSIETHWAGRFSLGASYYSQNPEWGLFGQAVVLRDEDAAFLPAFAIGVRNVGNCKSQDRFFAGCDVVLQADGTYENVTPEFYENFNTRPTFYGVATKEFSTGAMIGALPGSASLSLGYGNGTFQDDGGRGELYNKSGTIVEGLFLGGRLVTHPSVNTSLMFVAENDGWDWNAGVVYDWRGITLGAYASEIEMFSTERENSTVYNYTKFNVSLGYSGNIIDISRGVLLRSRITALTREEQRLRYEIANRERRIGVLEVALRRAQAGELASIEARRKQIESEVSAEREAIRQANERLRQIEQQQRGNPPSPTPPPTTPPAR